MRILVDGELFAEWSLGLHEFYEFSGLTPGCACFHPDDLLQEVYAARRAAYQKEADPLRLEAEYDALITESAPDFTKWIEAVQSIKDRFPLP